MQLKIQKSIKSPSQTENEPNQNNIIDEKNLKNENTSSDSQQTCLATVFDTWKNLEKKLFENYEEKLA